MKRKGIIGAHDPGQSWQGGIDQAALFREASTPHNSPSHEKSTPGILRNSVGFLCYPHYSDGQQIKKFNLLGDESGNQPWARDCLDFRAFPSTHFMLCLRA
jgi:hypothetical protein